MKERMGDRRSVYEHCRYTLGKPGAGGDWSDRGAITHAVEAGKTLCGFQVGTEREGWLRDSYARYADASYVSCRRCRRTLEAEARP